MALKIKGLDQISAWVAGLLAASGVVTICWYGSKYFVAELNEKKDKEISAVLTEINEINKDRPSELQKTDRTSDKNLDHSTQPKNSTAPLESYGYTGNRAPWYWAGLNEKWKECDAASGQSPIDLSGAKSDEKLKSLKFFYLHGLTNVSIQHQTVTGQIERGSYIEWDGERFDLKKVYFRTPSEHRVNSLPFEMEIQLEHVSADEKIIMVSTFMTPGKSNNALERLAKGIAMPPGDIKEIDRLNWSEVFPLKKTYWTYLGSRTIPPCNTGVRWIIFTNESTTSKSSIDQFLVTQKANARPVFSLGKRVLTRSNR